MHEVGQFIGKIQLGGEFVLFAGYGRRTDLEMHMDRSYWIPARVNSEKLCGSLHVGRLIPSEKLLSNRTESGISHIGINAHRIAMPDIDVSIR